MRVVRCTEVKQCLNYTLHSELCFTGSHHELFRSTTYDRNYKVRSKPLAHHNNALTSASTTRGNYNAYLLFLETKQSSLEEEFNALTAS